jgi:hypothetical protein
MLCCICTNTTMFPYMKEPQITVSAPKTKQTKLQKTKSNKYTVKPTKFKKMKMKAQIIQPGGRAKSNRWTEHGITTEVDIYNVDDSNGDDSETVKQQQIPTENAWLTKLHTISGEKNMQSW